MLQEGNAAPDFSLPDQSSHTHTLSDYRGQWVLIYFYPKDDTPGCTTEACGFRDAYDELQQKGCAVLGISKDSVDSHGKFADKYNLPFPLLADESQETIQAYGADKRMSVLIDPEGNINKLYPNVQPEKHPAEVLNKLK